MSLLQPNFFQFPNVIADELMQHLTGPEFLCLVVIIRKTRGWHRSSDAIALSQFQAMTGIKSKTTLLRALRVLEDPSVGLVRSTKRRLKPTVYELGEIFYSKKCNRETILKIETALCARNTIVALKPIPNIEHTKDNINKKRKGKARGCAQVKPNSDCSAPPAGELDPAPSSAGPTRSIPYSSEGINLTVEKYLKQLHQACKS